MTKIIKFILIISLLCTGLSVGLVSLAQENTTADAAISAQDLEVSEPTLLPDNPFYFLKEWGRGIQSFFTFGQLKKTELEQKFANERLIELKKMVEEGKVSSDVLKKATNKYEKTMEKIKEQADKIKDSAENSDLVNKFLDKFTNQQVLQEKILQKLETQVPQAVVEKIQKAREAHLEKFQQVMIKLETNKDKIAEKIKNALQNGDTSNTEILQKIKEKMPEAIQQKIDAIKANIANKVIEKIKQGNPVGADCPNIATVDPATFCPNGKIKAERDDKGCITQINCVLK